MQTVRAAVSDIINDLRSYDLDDKFSFRFLSHKLKDKIETFLKQDADTRNLFNINEIWKPLNHIELIDAPAQAYSEFYEYTPILRKSLKKIPEVYTTKYGNLIKVLNLRGAMEYKQIKSFQYKDIVNREYRNKNLKYFWIEGGYLFIPDSEVEEVKALGSFKDTTQAEQFNDSCKDCLKPLDSELLVPQYIVDLAKKQVLTELASISKRMVEDENPNLNQNVKS